MAMQRTTILLDAPAQKAAREVSAKLRITPSEVIRRALVNYRDQVIGPSPARRRQRVVTLRKLSRLFKGHRSAVEIRAIKTERERA